MDNQWHYMHNNQSVGPFSKDQIFALMNSGTLAKSTLIWKVGAEKWKPIEEVFNLADELPPPIPQTKSSQPLSASIKTSSWVDTAPHPWRRYFARMLDTSVSGAIFFVFFGFMFYAVSPHSADRFFNSLNDPSGRILDLIMTTFAASFVNAAFIGFTGSSFGKWFFGIKILDSNNQVLGYKMAFIREMKIWIMGLGLGIPIVSLFTLLAGYKKLTKDGITSWDESMNLRVVQRPEGTPQIILGIIGFIMMLIIFSILRAM